GDPEVGIRPHVLHHRGLEPGERRRELARHRTREGDRRRVALAREAVDHGTARISEAQEPGDLVERLPAASSTVSPRTRYAPGPAAAPTIVCPPDTGRPAIGVGGSGCSSQPA